MYGEKEKMFESDHAALEFAENQVERVERSMLALSCALGAGPDGTGASIRDSDLDGMLSLLADTLNDARKIMVNVYGNMLKAGRESGIDSVCCGLDLD
jgi:hypothetical protein